MAVLFSILKIHQKQFSFFSVFVPIVQIDTKVRQFGTPWFFLPEEKQQRRNLFRAEDNSTIDQTNLCNPAKVAHFLCNEIHELLVFRITSYGAWDDVFLAVRFQVFLAVWFQVFLAVWYFPITSKYFLMLHITAVASIVL